MTRIAILANSKRHDGMCLAGIDLDTRQWVRPVTQSGDGIPTQRSFVNGKVLSIRDIVTIDLIRPRTKPRFQRENRIICNWRWHISSRLRAACIQNYVDEQSPVLHTSNDRVDVDLLDNMPPNEWKSLQLVKPRYLQFERHYYDPNRWVASFLDSAGIHYSLKITDPIITRRLETRDQISRKDCLLTVSMTKPWTHDFSERPPTCYKLVAGVIEL